MKEVYLGLGSNLGDREAALRFAVDAIKRNIQVFSSSSIYETEPVGTFEQPDFLNMVIGCSTDKSPLELISILKKIESDSGRKIDAVNSSLMPRSIDIDILLMGDLILDSPGLVIPHPRMLFRKFVMVPLAEIASGFMHPKALKSINILLNQCEDSSIVRLYAVF